MTHYVGQRRSLKGQTCTVRYVGPVADKAGEWLGVEWDDPQRGKHNGTHEGRVYFICLSSSLTPASFLRPKQPWDKTRTFCEALREKYVSNNDTLAQEAIYFSTKPAEEIGFSKFAARQAELRGIHVVVLDRMCICHRIDDSETDTIEETCRNVTDLDLGGNLFENMEEVFDICRRLPKLRSLTLDGNRFTSLDTPPGSVMAGVKMLSLSNTLLGWETQVVHLLARVFPALESLVAARNEWRILPRAEANLPNELRTLDLAENQFTSLTDLVDAIRESQVQTLLLKNNHISHLGEPTPLFSDMHELDIRHNAVADWTFFNHFAESMPNMQHLRTAGNSLYQKLQSAEGKLLRAEDGYMLTIARLPPRLQTLNYSKITEKERLNAEVYYLSQIAVELSHTASQRERAAVCAKHPRWTALCAEYGEPGVKQISNREHELDPNNLAARLVTLHFALDFPSVARRWTKVVPKSFDIYALLGLVSKEIGIRPLNLRLMWETGERDPVEREGKTRDGVEWWDSSDEEISEAENEGWVEREVELVEGTRAIGSWVEAREARVRVEVKNQSAW